MRACVRGRHAVSNAGNAWGASDTYASRARSSENSRAGDGCQRHGGSTGGSQCVRQTPPRTDHGRGSRHRAKGVARRRRRHWRCREQRGRSQAGLRQQGLRHFRHRKAPQGGAASPGNVRERTLRRKWRADLNGTTASRQGHPAPKLKKDTLRQVSWLSVHRVWPAFPDRSSGMSGTTLADDSCGGSPGIEVHDL